MDYAKHVLFSLPTASEKSSIPTEKPKGQLKVDQCGRIVINGKTLPRFFKVQDVVAILGKADRSFVFEDGATILKNDWLDWGLRLNSFKGQGGAVFKMHLFPSRALMNIDIAPCWVMDENKKIALFYNKLRGPMFAIESLYKRNYDYVSFRFEKVDCILAAIANNDLAAVEEMLKNGADINKPNKFYKETPLNFAVRSEHVDCVKFLLQHGADKTRRDVWGKSPLENAMRLGYDEIARLLE